MANSINAGISGIGVEVPVKPMRGYHYEKGYGNYLASHYSMYLTCDCHSHQFGDEATRTGISIFHDWPVYRLSSRSHPEWNGKMVMLGPNGFQRVEVQG